MTIRSHPEVHEHVVSETAIVPQPDSASVKEDEASVGASSTSDRLVAQHPSRRRDRVLFIDVTRGILFLLMANTHALTLTDVSDESFWKSGFWLPNGWATVCFIALSGFAVGFLFPWQGSEVRTTRRLLRRGKEILIVMFLSNIFFLISAGVVRGDTSDLAEPTWWLGLLTLHTEYSISAILLPTGLMLLLAPGVLRLTDRRLRAWILPSMLGFSVLASTARHVANSYPPVPHMLDRLFVAGVGGFPVIPFIFFGLVGLALGWIARFRPPAAAGIVGTFVVCLVVLQMEWTSAPSPLFTIARGAITPSLEFSILLSTGWILAKYLPRLPVTKLLGLIGQYALFSFLLHRIILQASDIVSTRYFKLDNTTLEYGVLMVATFSVLGVLCYWRCVDSHIDRLWRAIYL